MSSADSETFSSSVHKCFRVGAVWGSARQKLSFIAIDNSHVCMLYNYRKNLRKTVEIELDKEKNLREHFWPSIKGDNSEKLPEQKGEKAKMTKDKHRITKCSLALKQLYYFTMILKRQSQVGFLIPESTPHYNLAGREF